MNLMSKWVKWTKWVKIKKVKAITTKRLTKDLTNKI